ncbi:hypothetical protein DVH05_021047 [Phytophthora capsici]|nr:hypothetical protein DVH05_021047 [Phytophthora capsici]
MRPVTYMHPFVIPVDLTRSMEAAIKTARAEQKEPDALDHRIKKQGIVLDLVASIDPKLWKFSGAFVGALTTFYAVKTKIRSWFEDQLFGMETGASGISGAAVQDRHQKLANEVISKFTSSSGWLNDSPVDFCLERIAEEVGHCFVLSTLAWGVGWPAAPKDPITGSSPDEFEWKPLGVVIVRLHYDEATEKLNVRVYMYEPLIDKDYHEKMEMVWGGVMEKNKLV